MSALEENETLIVRGAAPEDADACARIFFAAFASIAGRHNFPIEPGSPEFTRFAVGRMLGTEGIFGLIAEREGAIAGILFVDERGPIAAIGPVSVDPDTQDRGIGRALMEAVLRRERERGAPGVRLVQTAYHYRSPSTRSSASSSGSRCRWSRGRRRRSALRGSASGQRDGATSRRAEIGRAHV